MKIKKIEKKRSQVLAAHILHEQAIQWTVDNVEAYKFLVEEAQQRVMRNRPWSINTLSVMLRDSGILRNVAGKWVSMPNAYRAPVFRQMLQDYPELEDGVWGGKHPSKVDKFFKSKEN